MTMDPMTAASAAHPTATAARFPAEYGGGRARTAELMAWDDVAERIAASPNYWLATTTDTGRPHLRPIDGVFVRSILAFGGAPITRWVQHLEHRPVASVSLPDDDHAVVLEGDVELVTDPAWAISEAVLAANVEKYPHYFDAESVFHPFWMLRPRRVFAWTLTDFPARATRFDFERALDGHQGTDRP